MIAAVPGSGRSRMLDLFVLEAKLLGGIAGRASGLDGAAGPFGVARTLVGQLHASAPRDSLAVARQDPEVLQVLFNPDRVRDADQQPEPGMEGHADALYDFTRAGHNAGTLQGALRRWMVGLSRRRPVALAVDDLESADPASVALLAAIAVQADQQHISYAASVAETTLKEPSRAVRVLIQHARPMSLAPLAPEQTALLLRSVFGDVPNLQGAARQLHGLSAGRPRECLALAQHLVDQGTIRLEGGAWVLPPSLKAEALPASVEDALALRIGHLSPTATEVAALLSLSVVGRLSGPELEELVGGSRAELQAALDELRRAGVVAGDPHGYVAHTVASGIILERCTPDDRARLHTGLAAMHARRQTTAFVVANHLLLGPDPEQGLHLMRSHMQDQSQELGFAKEGVAAIGITGCAEMFKLARAEARRLACPAGEQLKLALWLEIAATQGADLNYFYLVADEATAVLKRATGFDDWVDLSDVTNPRTRVLEALARADARYKAAPTERVGPPSDAIRLMVVHCLQANAVGARGADLELMAGLPGLLEPFTTLSPLVAAMRRLITASHLFHRGADEEGRALSIALLDDLAELDRPELPWIDYVRASVRLRVDLASVTGGLAPESALDPEDAGARSLRAHVEDIRRIAALQRGEWDVAEGHRRRAELLALEHGAARMMNWTRAEWPVHARLQDLTGLRAIRERLVPLAARHPGWVPEQLAVDAWYHRLCDQPAPALAAVHALRERVLGLHIVPSALYLAVEVEVAVLVETGQPRVALERGLPALAACHADGRRMLARGLSLEIALAEAALWDHAGARARIEGEIAWQLELGVTGLPLGHSYEYLARAALARGDQPAFEAAATVVAREYRVRAGSMLAGRYRQLLERAQRAQVDAHALVLPPDAGPTTTDRWPACSVVYPATPKPRHWHRRA